MDTIEHYGLYVGFYLDGRQIGAGRRWKITPVPTFNSAGDGSGSSNNPDVILMKGWRARVLSYRLEEGVRGKELEFRFADKHMYFKTRGRMTTPDVKVGVNTAEEIKMEGDASLKAVFPR